MSLSLAGDGTLTGVTALPSFPVGKILQVKSAIFTGTQTASVAARGNVAITDLSITHEVADSANKLIISAFIGVAANSVGRANTGIAVHDGTELIAIGDADGVRTQVTSGGFQTVNTANYVVSWPSATFVHTPGAGSKTYTLRAINIASTTETVYINRSATNDNDSGRSLGVSSLVIQEVSV